MDGLQGPVQFGRRIKTRRAAAEDSYAPVLGPRSVLTFLFAQEEHIVLDIPAESPQCSFWILGWYERQLVAGDMIVERLAFVNYREDCTNI